MGFNTDNVPAGNVIKNEDGTFSVWILWGSDSYVSAGDSATEYRYNTEKEIIAFIDGIDAASGYLEYTMTVPDYVVPKEEEEEEEEESDEDE